MHDFNFALHVFFFCKRKSELVKLDVLHFMEWPQIFYNRNWSPIRLTAPIGVKYGDHLVISPKFKTTLSHGPRINAEANLNWKSYVLLLLLNMLARLKIKLGSGFAQAPKSKTQFQYNAGKVLVELILAWPTSEFNAMQWENMMVNMSPKGKKRSKNGVGRNCIFIAAINNANAPYATLPLL